MADLPSSPRIDALIRWAAAKFQESSTPTIDARALAKCAFNLDEAGLVTQSKQTIGEALLERFVAMVERRANAEPVAHIIGRREFWSLDIEVEPGILVPRPDSETLIDAVVRRRSADLSLRIADLGCGSGALLCALLKEFPHAKGVGVDINEQAVAVTARNLSRLGFSDRAQAARGRWFDVVEGAFDVVISNPPYIPLGRRDSLPREVREYESPLALFGGEDGFDAYRQIAAGAREHIAPDGLMVLEFGEGQACVVNEIAATALPEAQIVVEKDLAGRPRALVIDLQPRRD